MKYEQYTSYFENIRSFKTKYDIMIELDIDKDLDNVIRYFYNKKFLRKITSNKITYYISRKVLEEKNISVKDYFNLITQNNIIEPKLKEVSFVDIFNIKDFCKQT